MSDDGLGDLIALLEHKPEETAEMLSQQPNVILSDLRELRDARAEIAARGRLIETLRQRPVIETGEPPRDETVVYVQVSVPVRWDFGAGEWVSVPPHMKFPDMPPALWTREPMRGE